jgi:hypothetical protein
MKARLVTLTLTLSALIALSAAVSTQAATQGNSNKSRPPKRAKANANAAAPAAQAKPATSAEKPVAAKPAKKKKKKAPAMAGVPSGVENCIKRLQQLAEKDPLPDYDGQPSKIVNEGLLWNDPKAKCSVAGDEAKRNKVVEMATAWRMKDAAKVRSLLSELAM